MEKSLEKDLLKAVLGVIDFPCSQICKHLVAADLLSIMEKHGVKVSEELAETVVSAHDDEAYALLADQIAKLSD